MRALLQLPKHIATRPYRSPSSLCRTSAKVWMIAVSASRAVSTIIHLETLPAPASAFSRLSLNLSTASATLAADFARTTCRAAQPRPPG